MHKIPLPKLIFLQRAIAFQHLEILPTGRENPGNPLSRTDAAVASLNELNGRHISQLVFEAAAMTAPVVNLWF